MGQTEEGEGTGGEKRKRQTTTVMKARGGSNHSTEPNGGRLLDERDVKSRFSKKGTGTYNDGEKNDLRSGSSGVQTLLQKGGHETSWRKEGEGGVRGGW